MWLKVLIRGPGEIFSFKKGTPLQVNGIEEKQPSWEDQLGGRGFKIIKGEITGSPTMELPGQQTE